MLSVTEARRGLEQETIVGDELTALATHDSAAWQRLFDGHYEKMYRFAYVRTGDTSAAEEIAAEVFVAAAKGIGKYRPTGAPFAAWLYRIARNLTADHLERRRKRPTVALDGIEVSAGDWPGEVENSVDLRQAMRALTRDQQEVLILRFFAACSLEETAGAMNRSVGAVKVLQHRALDAMKKQLSRGGSS